ncbi:MAG TPA: PQQ-dependent sugar dehydrogenase [Verrucomicrobiae bacterium]|jgi:glucose/arabinose dehydrogenase|nr:PQQ-dependent sugar dehydrogenase [Verrucomicrobiae bacterium]
MKQRSATVILSLGLLVLPRLPAVAQPLPHIRLRAAFPALTLDRPVWMCQAPDGSDRRFIVEQTGRILIIPGGSDGSVVKEFLNITERKPYVDFGANTHVGLISIAFHPGYKTNGLFYIFYAQTNANPTGQFPRRNVISEFKVSATDPDRADPASERVVLEVPEPFNSNQGGELGFGPDGYLYISLGDGGSNNDPFNNGQNTATLLGKILRIDVNTRSTTGAGRNLKQLQYGIPGDNPFVAEPDTWGGLGVRKEIYAWGLRNAWRYSWDRKTGDLWAGDVGEKLWEEVDLIVKGGNYGWCVREGAHGFKPGPPGAQYVEPVMEYPHGSNQLSQSQFPRHSIGLCVIGGYVYRGKKYPSLEGVYVYGDFVLGTIWGFRYADGRVTDYETLLQQPKNITSFAEDADGELYVLSFSERNDGHIYAIEAE